MSFISVKNLDFDYPKKKILKDVSFEIEQGSVVALVGKNGAGKTTLMRCMTSLEKPVSGSVTIDGIDVHDRPRDAHRSMGYLSDFFGLYNDLTVRQCLTYMGWCHKIPAKQMQDKVVSLAGEVGITDYLDAPAGTLSRGYRQRLGVGLALIHSPKVLFLDEPASGMDPEARAAFSQLILSLKERGMTIIVSSHILSELEDYCTSMLVIRDGEIISHTTPEQQHQGTSVVLHIEINALDEEHAAILSADKFLENVQVSGNIATCTFTGDAEEQQKLLRRLVRKNVPVLSLTPEKKTLQSAYMDLAQDKSGAAE